jgi:hypothetical protein
VEFAHKNASEENEIQSVLDESLESLSTVAQMNTDGHAKGYAFDGLHSRFPAVPLIPIYFSSFTRSLGLFKGWNVWRNIILWMTVNIGDHYKEANKC